MGAALAGCATAPSPDQVNRATLTDGQKHTINVNVDGSGYKVKVKGDSVWVSIRGIAMVGDPLVRRKQMRQAVRDATGCEVLDDQLDINMHLIGRLDC
jgi:hypothetical protein